MKLAKKIIGIALASVFAISIFTGCAKKDLDGKNIPKGFIVDEDGNVVAKEKNKVQNEKSEDNSEENMENEIPEPEDLSVRKNIYYYENFDNAKAEAKKTGKRIFLVMSNDEWDMKSTGLKDTCLFKKQFIDAMSKNYVLVNCNWSEKEFGELRQKTGKNKKEQKAIDQRMAEYVQKIFMSNVYVFQQTPTMFILNKDGYYIANIPVNAGIGDPESLISMIKENEEQLSKFETAFSEVEKAAEEEKLNSIKQVYDMVPEYWWLSLNNLAKEAVKYDEANGFYHGLIAKHDSIVCLSKNDTAGAIKCFEDMVANVSLTEYEMFEAYLNCAMINQRANTTDFDTTIKYLELAKSKAQDPEQIKAMEGNIQGVKQQQQKYMEYMAAMAAEGPAAAPTEESAAN